MKGRASVSHGEQLAAFRRQEAKAPSTEQKQVRPGVEVPPHRPPHLELALEQSMAAHQVAETVKRSRAMEAALQDAYVLNSGEGAAAVTGWLQLQEGGHGDVVGLLVSEHGERSMGL